MGNVAVEGDVAVKLLSYYYSTAPGVRNNQNIAKLAIMRRSMQIATAMIKIRYIKYHPE